MTNEELSAFTESLKNVGEDPAYFAIFADPDNPDSFNIHANENGLKLYAAELLKSILKANEDVSLKHGEVYLNLPWTANDDVFITSVKFVSNPPKPIHPALQKETLSGKISKAGCIAFLIFLLIAAVVGGIQIIRAVF